jgi:hypothetical protein
VLVGALGVAPASGTLGVALFAVEGTVLSLVVLAAILAAGAGSAFSLPHSIHNNVATISQAKIRNTRVWFMWECSSGRRTQPAQAHGI